MLLRGADAYRNEARGTRWASDDGRFLRIMLFGGKFTESRPGTTGVDTALQARSSCCSRGLSVFERSVTSPEVSDSLTVIIPEPFKLTVPEKLAESVTRVCVGHVDLEV